MYIPLVLLVLASNVAAKCEFVPNSKLTTAASKTQATSVSPETKSTSAKGEPAPKSGSAVTSEDTAAAPEGAGDSAADRAAAETEDDPSAKTTGPAAKSPEACGALSTSTGIVGVDFSKATNDVGAAYVTSGCLVQTCYFWSEKYGVGAATAPANIKKAFADPLVGCAKIVSSKLDSTATCDQLNAAFIGFDSKYGGNVPAHYQTFYIENKCVDTLCPTWVDTYGFVSGKSATAPEIIQKLFTKACEQPDAEGGAVEGEAPATVGKLYSPDQCGELCTKFAMDGYSNGTAPEDVIVEYNSSGCRTQICYFYAAKFTDQKGGWTDAPPEVMNAYSDPKVNCRAILDNNMAPVETCDRMRSAFSIVLDFSTTPVAYEAQFINSGCVGGSCDAWEKEYGIECGKTWGTATEKVKTAWADPYFNCHGAYDQSIGKLEGSADPKGAKAPADPKGPKAPADPKGAKAPADPKGPKAPADPKGPKAPADPKGAKAPADPKGQPAP